MSDELVLIFNNAKLIKCFHRPEFITLFGLNEC